MYLHRIYFYAMFTAFTATMPAAAHSVCDARSGPKTTALVELYTSEGCSSCPPADRQLSQLRQVLDPVAEVVPLALHVDYWDSIGWKDPYAQALFGERQSRLVSANRQKTVYTPQYFISGTETRSGQSELRKLVVRINALPAAADIRLQVGAKGNRALALIADATVTDTKSPALLYLAITESGLVSNVTRGENKGVTLAHDYVVRAWIGPIQLTNGVARVERELVLPAEWSRAQLDVIAFVQAEHDGKVLQALRAQHCAGS